MTDYPDELCEFPDYHCPYICHDHMLENEAKATGFAGFSAPRARKMYPYTNKQPERGWSMYEPLEPSHTLLYALPIPSVVSLSDNLNEQLVDTLRHDPESFATFRSDLLKKL